MTVSQVTEKGVESLDITGAQIVQIQMRCDGKVVWINVDGICRLRVCQIYKVEVEDDRPAALEVNK